MFELTCRIMLNPAAKLRPAPPETPQTLMERSSEQEQKIFVSCTVLQTAPISSCDRMRAQSPSDSIGTSSHSAHGSQKPGSAGSAGLVAHRDVRWKLMQRLPILSLSLKVLPVFVPIPEPQFDKINRDTSETCQLRGILGALVLRLLLD